MADTTEKKGANNNERNGVYPFLNALLSAIHWEIYSPVGKMNIIFDFGLLAILVLYILSSSVTAIARIVASIFNSELTSQTKDNIFGLIFIFIVAFCLCLLIIHFTQKETENYRDD